MVLSGLIYISGSHFVLIPSKHASNTWISLGLAVTFYHLCCSLFLLPTRQVSRRLMLRVSINRRFAWTIWWTTLAWLTRCWHGCAPTLVPSLAHNLVQTQRSRSMAHTKLGLPGSEILSIAWMPEMRPTTSHSAVWIPTIRLSACSRLLHPNLTTTFIPNTFKTTLAWWTPSRWI